MRSTPGSGVFKKFPDAYPNGNGPGEFSFADAHNDTKPSKRVTFASGILKAAPQALNPESAPFPKKDTPDIKTTPSTKKALARDYDPHGMIFDLEP